MPLCFDLDGTLGLFGGGFLLLREALGEVWGEQPDEAELGRCQGSTDWEIVDQMYRARHGAPIPDADYAAYDRACLARFEATFHPEGRAHTAFQGLITGMARLVDLGHRVWLVSGNTPSVLAFKARVLGVDPRIPRLGSLPGLDRADLIRRALQGCPGPHLYVGDRPHDRLAAERAGVPFLGVGSLVPGNHPILDPGAEAEHLVRAVATMLNPGLAPGFPPVPGPCAPPPGRP
jgi:phosphoglycolate phosphatase-like HAD superfamily hydrolase